MTRNTVGYSMIEIVVILFIVVSLTSMSVFTLTSYLPKQRLLESVEATEKMLSYAQLEATSRAGWVCIKYDPATRTLSSYLDLNGNHVTWGVVTCGDTFDQLFRTEQLRHHISFHSCGWDFSSRPLWIDSSGIPEDCGATPSPCAPTSYQMILTNSQLPTGNRAREVEITTTGIIQTVNRNEKGNIDTVFAKSAELPLGCD